MQRYTVLTFAVAALVSIAAAQHCNTDCRNQCIMDGDTNECVQSCGCLGLSNGVTAMFGQQQVCSKSCKSNCLSQANQYNADICSLTCASECNQVCMFMCDFYSAGESCEKDCSLTFPDNIQTTSTNVQIPIVSATPVPVQVEEQVTIQSTESSDLTIKQVAQQEEVQESTPATVEAESTPIEAESTPVESEIAQQEEEQVIPVQAVESINWVLVSVFAMIALLFVTFQSRKQLTKGVNRESLISKVKDSGAAVSSDNTKDGFERI